MKTKIMVLIGVCFALLAPVSGFALFDFNLYGGLPFSGEFDDASQKTLDTNYAYGASAHFNSDFLEIFQLGLGGFYELGSATYENGSEFSLDRSTLGLEAYLQLELPLIPLSPYIKAGTAAWNKVESDGASVTDNFEKHRLGAGFVFTVLPIPMLLRLQLFAEYMYDFGKEDDLNVTQHNVFVGLRADLF